MNLRMKYFFIYNIGCYMRELEAEWISNVLTKNGIQRTYNPKLADYLFIITCAYTHNTQRRSTNVIKRIRAIARSNSNIVIGGCLPIINPDILTSLGNFKFLPAHQIFKLQHIVDFKLNIEGFKLPNEIKTEPLIKRAISSLRVNGLLTFLDYAIKYIKTPDTHAYYIPLSIGCTGNCTFCGIKKVHGKLISRAPVVIKEEFLNGLKKGYKIFYLLSKDIGAYGWDINYSLVSLMKELFVYPKDYIIHFPSAINARWFVKLHKGLIRVLKENPNRLNELSISVQSASENVLQAMGRAFSQVSMLQKAILEFKNNLPDIQLDAQFMVGFPGETDNDLKLSIEFIKKVKFNSVTLFKYDDIPDTLASAFSNKVTEQKKAERINKMINELTRLRIKCVVANP